MVDYKNKKKAHQTTNSLMCLKKLFRKKCQKVKDSHKWSLNMNISLLNGCLSQQELLEKVV